MLPPNTNGMAMLKQLGNFLGGGVAKPIRDIAGTFVAPKDTRALNEHEYKLAVLQQFQAYTTSEKGSVFERFVSGLNALPRPILALGSIFLVGYSIYDSERATAAYAALEIIPTELWGMLGIVVSFYMGGRLQIKALNAKERAQRIDNMEKTSNLVMSMIDRLDAREQSDKVSPDTQ